VLTRTFFQLFDRFVFILKGVVGWDDGYATIGGNYFPFITQNPSRFYKCIRESSSWYQLKVYYRK
jgi:hypothetical protein